MNVLIIEDNLNNFHAIEQLLRRLADACPTLLHAVNLYDGLKQIRAGNVDVILLSAELSGFTVSSSILALCDQFPEIPIITIGSAQSSENGRFDFIERSSMTPELLHRMMITMTERTRSDDRYMSLLESRQLVNDRKLAEERLRYRHAIEALVTNISTRFINLSSDTIDSGMTYALQSLGKFTGVDRCYIYLLSSDFTCFDDGYEWCAPGVANRIQTLRGTSFTPYSWLMARFKDREPVYVANTDEMDPEASAEKVFWQSESVRTALAIPLILNNMLFGFWGMESIRVEKPWSQEDIRLFHMMGSVFMSALARKQAEQALLAARRQLDQLFNSVSDALWTAEVDSAGSFMHRYISPVVKKITGRPPEFFSLSRDPWLSIIHPDDRSFVWEAFQRLHPDQEESLELEYRILLPDGTLRWVRDSQTCAHLTNERIRIDAVLSDITERKQAEEGLHHRYAIEGLVTSLSTRFINLETQEVETEIQHALEKIGEFTGVDRCYLDLFAADGKSIQTAYTWCAPFSITYEDPDPLTMTPFPWSMSKLRRFEPIYVHRIADLPPEAESERAFWERRGRKSVLNIPVVIDDRLLGYFGFASDRVEKEWAEEDIRLLQLMSNVFAGLLARKKAEDVVIASEAQYRMLADSISDVVALHELNGDLIFVSPSIEKITGLTPQEQIDMGINEFVHPDEQQNLHKIFQKVDNKKTSIVDDQMKIWRCKTKNGTYLWMETSFRVIHADGKPFRILTTSRNITGRKETEQALHVANQKLQNTVAELEQNNLEMKRLNELGDLLQGCLSVEDVYSVVAACSPFMFPNCSGALFITNPSKKLVESVKVWGVKVNSELMFTPDACWALRRGRPHLVNMPVPDLECKHIVSSDQPVYACVPLIAQGESLGIFYIECSSDTYNRRSLPLASMVAERVALALANLRLREILQRQSIRDSMTGLFNRRYMETAVERELRQSARDVTPIGFVMMDIDFFKQFNDSYGHGAGDALLTAVGNYLLSNVRGSDIACRYGGDEFVLILPKASMEATLERAEQIRAGLCGITVQYRNVTIGPITVSMGVSAYPDHGISMDHLLNAADNALYAAKAKGRNIVSIAPKRTTSSD
jgi:diguanylate cyclase (GGDEF)-like protein/PAS domain S-box-containing protein